MIKIKNKMFILVMTLVTVLSTIINVNAAADTIQLGDPGKTGSYIAGLNFSYKVTTSGQDLFCLDMHRNTAKNITAKLVKNSSYINGGLIYILKNGYPEKSITGDKDKDYYITQTAVWWYLDITTGSSNLNNSFKETGADNYGLRKYVKALVNEAVNHKNDSVEIKKPKLEISANSLSLTMEQSIQLEGQKKYYSSEEIKASKAENIDSYNVTLTGAPKGTIIVKNDNTTFEYTKEFNVKNNETFKIKVLSTEVNDTDLSIKVEAKAEGQTQYMAYEYQPTNTKMQNVALLEKTKENVVANLTLSLSTSKVTITKIDSKTKQAIAGAELVLKTVDGNEITRWTSTQNAHVIRNLTNGTYIIEETKAPTGYKLNDNEVKFTVSDSNKDIKISFENTPKSVVVTILKIDEATNKPLAGATLVIKDESGEIVYKFVTTEEVETITDLANGKYTVEEISAPTGYVKSNKVVEFTIDDEHLSHQITFKNTKEVDVPDTANFSSIIMMILGISITGLGLRFIYKNGKKV